ncbi:MAG: DUF4878 domain-containing protein [Acidobacteria bacterium]|jgi:hypothetical protein|nr:MAG: DUF4878 domain-containing protein [Acidobacteriota bacterium]
MKKAALAIGAVLLAFFVFRACGEDTKDKARGTVKEFIERVRDGEGKEAVKLLYAPYRDALSQDFKLPIQLTEMKPSEVLACVLSSMGENIKRVKYLDVREIDDKHAEVLVKVIDREGVEKILAFIVIKDEKNWRIANISGIR